MFGLALPKQLLIPQGVRPVQYVPYGTGAGVMAQQPKIEDEWDDVTGLIETHVISLFGGRTGAEPGSYEADRIEEWIEFGALAYVKFFDPALAPMDPDNFYMEREWRSHSGVVFKTADISRLYVAPGWENKAEARFPDLAGRIRALP